MSFFVVLQTIYVALEIIWHFPQGNRIQLHMF